MTARFSSLPILEYCSEAPKLNIGSGRAAVISSCFHALCAADTEEYLRLSKLLTPDELAEIKAWHVPEWPSDLDELHLECGLALDSMGYACERGAPEAIVSGTADVVMLKDGLLTLIDLKRSHRTASANSLQILGYMVAAAQRFGATRATCGVFSLTEGTLRTWKTLAVGCDEWNGIVDRVLAAASNNEGEYRTGPHCDGCWGRFRCPAWGLDDGARTELAQLVGGALDHGKAARLLELASRAKDLADRATEHVRAYVANAGPIRAGDQMWGPVEVAGRSTFDRKALERDHPALAVKYTVKGAPTTRYQWKKVKS